MSLVYVYAIAQGAPSTNARGIDEQPIRWISNGELQAAVSDVPAEEFSEQALNAGLTDMQWLGPRAIAHQDVNQQLHEHAEALLPLAFGTVFRDDARVQAMLAEHAKSLKRRLERVSGSSEWVVTVHRTGEPDPTSAAPVQAMRAEIEQATPGRAHLLRKRLADLERDEARRMQGQAADDVLESLREQARDIFVEPLPQETAERPLLRASILVRKVDEARFVKLVEGLQTYWYTVMLTGPWPAYRFGGLEHAAAAATH
jgi:hypothetical protein